jgi:hypothetical protein
MQNCNRRNELGKSKVADKRKKGKMKNRSITIKEKNQSN